MWLECAVGDVSGELDIVLAVWRERVLSHYVNHLPHIVHSWRTVEEDRGEQRERAGEREGEGEQGEEVQGEKEEKTGGKLTTLKPSLVSDFVSSGTKRERYFGVYFGDVLGVQCLVGKEVLGARWQGGQLECLTNVVSLSAAGQSVQ